MEKKEKSASGSGLKAGDFIKIEFTGKAKSTGKVFDTTDEGEAKKANVFNERVKYAPQLVVFGRGQLIPGLEEALSSMKAGEEKDIEVAPEKGFGQKDQNLVRVMPLADFAKQNIKPLPGMVLNFGNSNALVRSVSSGRVVVDFNHPLAGEALSYKVKLSSIVSEPKAKADALIDSLGLRAEAKLNGGALELRLIDANLSNEFIARKKSLIENLAAYLPELNEIRVLEEYRKMEPEKGKAPAEQKASAEKASAKK